MKRRFSKVGFNKTVIIDTIGAALIVQQAPKLVDMLIPLDPSIRALAGVGVGYAAGSLLKRPGLANASIGLGVVDFISPMVDDLFGGGTPTQVKPPSSSVMVPVKGGAVSNPALESYFSLNDYLNNPGDRLNYSDYSNSYSY
jgi:hypothetical protein